jgi:hypothetical protein
MKPLLPLRYDAFVISPPNWTTSWPAARLCVNVTSMGVNQNIIGKFSGGYLSHKSLAFVSFGRWEFFDAISDLYSSAPFCMLIVTQHFPPKLPTSNTSKHCKTCHTQQCDVLFHSHIPERRKAIRDIIFWRALSFIKIVH